MFKMLRQLIETVVVRGHHRITLLQWATKVLGHLAKKLIFERLGHIFPPSPQTMLIFLFLLLHRPQRLHNIELGGWGIRELTLDANKLEQVAFKWPVLMRIRSQYTMHT